MKNKILNFIKKQIKNYYSITKGTKTKVYFEVEGFSGVYNKDIVGGSMSLTKADKEWIVSAIVEGIKPVVQRLDKIEARLGNVIKKNDLKE